MNPDSEYHRRRAESEMDMALSATLPTIAIKHLELAKLHREVRDQIAESARSLSLQLGCVFDRTDKEA